MPETSKRLAKGLGWASLGLGVPQTVAPRQFAEAIGARPDARASAITRSACGLRELPAAAGILKLSDPPTMWLWSRVAGDLFDLSLLWAAGANRPRDRKRLTYAAGAVGGVLAADLFAAIALTAKRKGRPTEPAVSGESPEDRVAVTIRHPREGLERLWRDREQPAWAKDATISFRDAPGDRGTEILVQLARRGDDTKAKEDLRRFKQVVETGEVVRADGVPEGERTLRNIKQRPAQPVEVTR